MPACWKISGKSTVKTVPSTITFTGSSTPDTFITIEHAHNPVKPDQPVQPGDKTPDGKTTIDGGHKADLNQTITRTVNITDPHTGNTTTTTQTAHITRTGDLDEVSGHVTYGSWTTDDKGWVAVDVPNVPGYTPSQPSVDAVVVKNGQKDQILTPLMMVRKLLTTLTRMARKLAILKSLMVRRIKRLRLPHKYPQDGY